MVFFQRTLAFFWKSTKAVHVNNLVPNVVGIKFFGSEVQIVRPVFQKKKKEIYRIGGIAYFMLIMPITAFGLGVWQVLRKFEKNEMIRILKEKSSIPPTDLPKDLSQLKDMEFRAVRVKGRFDHSKELYVGPRPLNNENSLDALSLLSIPKGGYLVITPFTLSDRDLTILVNRGWVPGNKKSPESRKEGQITDEVELVGLVRLTERRPQFSMKNKPEKGFWIYKNLEEMSEVTKASPVLIEIFESSSVPGGPIGGQTKVTLKDDHVNYAITWFGMSLVTGWMWYNRYIRRAVVPRGLIF